MSRVTITMRHTGRICIGLDAQTFAALYANFLFARRARSLLHWDHATGSLPAHEKLEKAFTSFSDKISRKLEEVA